MPTELRITFAGLCLAVIDPDSGDLCVLLPDGRVRNTTDRGGRNHSHHLDGRKVVEHAGYLRIDLANLIAAGKAPLPAAEVIHRLRGQQLALEYEPVEGDVERDLSSTPNFKLTGIRADRSTNGITDGVVVAPELFSDTPPPELLARLTLRGGVFFSGPPNGEWKFAPTLRDRGTFYGGEFSGSMTWRMMIQGGVVLRLEEWESGREAESFVLHPVRVGEQDVIELKIANLCAHNPLEWDELTFQTTHFDEDFKWFYRLLTPASGMTWNEALGGGELPYPAATVTTGPEGISGCSPSAIIQPHR